MQLIIEKRIGIKKFSKFQRNWQNKIVGGPGVDVIFEHIGGSHFNKELTLY